MSRRLFYLDSVILEADYSQSYEDHLQEACARLLQNNSLEIGDLAGAVILDRSYELIYQSPFPLVHIGRILGLPDGYPIIRIEDSRMLFDQDPTRFNQGILLVLAGDKLLDLDEVQASTISYQPCLAPFGYEELQMNELVIDSLRLDELRQTGLAEVNQMVLRYRKGERVVCSNLQEGEILTPIERTIGMLLSFEDDSRSIAHLNLISESIIYLPETTSVPALIEHHRRILGSLPAIPDQITIGARSTAGVRLLLELLIRSSGDSGLSSKLSSLEDQQGFSPSASDLILVALTITQMRASQNQTAWVLLSRDHHRSLNLIEIVRTDRASNEERILT